MDCISVQNSSKHISFHLKIYCKVWCFSISPKCHQKTHSDNLTQQQAHLFHFSLGNELHKMSPGSCCLLVNVSPVQENSAGYGGGVAHMCGDQSISSLSLHLIFDTQSLTNPSAYHFSWAHRPACPDNHCSLPPCSALLLGCRCAPMAPRFLHEVWESTAAALPACCDVGVISY